MIAADKKPLFSLTAKDCRWDFFVGSGDGGQNKQKTNSAARCTHEPSGAVGVSQEERSQELNKRKAFRKMAESKEFKTWLRIHVARITGEEEIMKQKVDEMMKPHNIKVEGNDEEGRWAPIEDKK
jgi:hypothetical protein